MPVKLQSLGVVVQVEVGVAQLAVDSTKDLQVFCAHLDGSFKKGDACPVIAHLTEALTLQRQLQARNLHPTADEQSQRVRTDRRFQLAELQDAMKQNKPAAPRWFQKTLFSSCDPQPTNQSFRQGMLLSYFLPPSENNGSSWAKFIMVILTSL